MNFFDNAEIYAEGDSGSDHGQGAQRTRLAAHQLRGLDQVLLGHAHERERQNTLNRKYLLDAIDGSLQRLQLDHVDLVYCHRADPNTPIEETVWAMHDIIARGKALYWGTSEWNADESVPHGRSPIAATCTSR